MISLPQRPRSLRHAPVAAWSEPVVIPTYPTPPADRNPMFLENRVYQGSSGRVYPNPVIDSVSNQSVDRAWTAVHLENEYLRLMVLPEIGGRIHVGMDRTNGYDFFYRQNVIKPALGERPIQLALSAAAILFHALRLDHRGTARRWADGLVLGARAHGPHEGHARCDRPPRIFGSGDPCPSLQPDAGDSHVPLVGQRRRQGA